jgi:hypothetical protein
MMKRKLKRKMKMMRGEGMEINDNDDEVMEK